MITFGRKDRRMLHGHNDGRIDRLYDYPFRRLQALLGAPAPGLDPIALHIGEPQGRVPESVSATIAENGTLWGRYPPLKGPEGYRRSVASWLSRRYDLPDDAVDPEKHICAVSGTREALFQVALFAAARKKDRLSGNERPVIALPNPFYHVYLGGALMADADVISVDATEENDFVPDFEAMPAEMLDRLALIYLCTPGNPTGRVADRARLERIVALARRHDAILVVDECYSEIYFGEEPPTGGLEAAYAIDGNFRNVLTFNSMSKRSGVPGIRVGFVAGDAALIEGYSMLRAYGGAQVPEPLAIAAAELWDDEGHVVANRALYSELLAIADEELSGAPWYRRPEAAFFLWLPVGDGEAAAKRLWEEAAVKVIPGRYMSRPDAKTGISPGDRYIRAALVHEPSVTRKALRRMRKVLGG